MSARRALAPVLVALALAACEEGAPGERPEPPANPAGREPAAGAGVTSAPAAAPAFEMIGLSPGEGIPRFLATGEPLELRGAPSLEAPLVRVARPAAGTVVESDSGRYRTTVPGRIEAVRATEVEGRSLGSGRALTRDAYSAPAAAPGRWALEPGETRLWLQGRAEGSCFVRIDDALIEANPCPSFVEAFRVLSPPVTEWWIRAAPDGGAPGWTLVTDRTLEVRRSF